MHKRSLYLAVAAILFVGACAPTSEREGPAEQPEGDPVPVQLGMGLMAGTQTKAAGAVDRWTGSQRLFIYGFPLQGNVPVITNPFINNVGAYSPDSGNTGLLALYNPAVTQSNEPFYYAEGVTYDFFGYYVDDATTYTAQKPDVTLVPNEGYKVDLTITGSQDIMIAGTDRVLASANTNLPLQRVFSAYAARRDVHPELTFKHVLSRFRFRLISGSASAASNVTVDAISVRSNSQAGLIVAGPGATGELLDEGTPAWLSLGLPSAQALPDVGSPAYDLPGSVMVMPGQSSYKLQMHMNQEGVTEGPDNTQELEIDLTKIQPLVDQVAVAGHQYWVNITVYDLEAVRITVSLDEWDYQDAVVVDPDKEIYVTASTPAPISAVGGTLDIPVSSPKTFEYVIDANWIHLATNSAPSTKVDLIEETLHLIIDQNMGRTRTGTITFTVEGKSDLVLSITQDGAGEIPDSYGVYVSGGDDYIFNPASELISVYQVSSQRWSRFLFPATNTVYELGPIPASLSLNQEFTATYSISVNGQVTSSREVHLTVFALEGSKVKLLDTDRLDGYTIIY